MAKKSYLIASFFIAISIIYITRLFFLQTVDWDDYQAAAEKNIIQKTIEKPYRGLIYDRHGHILVYNAPVFDIQCIPAMMHSWNLDIFCRYFPITKKNLTEKIKKAQTFSKVKPYTLIQGIPQQYFAYIQEKLMEFPGCIARVCHIRRYTYPILAKTIGYMGKISPQEKKKKKYLLNDWVGKTGLEKQYDDILRGNNGWSLHLINAQGSVQGKYRQGNLDILPIPGKNIITTIDSALQNYGTKLLQGKIGSIVAIDPNNGEVLTIVSSPSYDPNEFAAKAHTSLQHLLQDPTHPLFHRATMAIYPPGSIFKTIQGLLALQEGVIQPFEKILCHQKKVKCHPHRSPTHLITAIQFSCNPYFYTVFKKMMEKYTDVTIGFQIWRARVLQFGLGKPLGIDIPTEKGGYIPTIAAYDQKYGHKQWQHSHIRSLDIGQGEILITPLQMANIAAIIANKGFYYQPHLVKSIGDMAIKCSKHTLDISKTHFDVIQKGMFLATKNTWRAFIKHMPFACKTGTVENPHGADHSVFIAFAPQKKPKIAIAVYVENAGWGGRSAAAIGSLMIEKYLNAKITRPWIEQYVLKGHFLD